MYYIFEIIQVDEEEYTHNVETFSEYYNALSTYYTKLATAVIANDLKHTVILLNTDGNVIQSYGSHYDPARPNSTL